ncbi:hypothetical protein Tco_1009345 [Tanacetum coccineum]
MADAATATTLPAQQKDNATSTCHTPDVKPAAMQRYNKKCIGYLVHAYYNISPTRYYKDDPCWSADLKSKTTEDIINIGSFVEVLVLNRYVLSRKIFSDNNKGPSIPRVLVNWPSIQGLLDWYGYNTVEEYLSDTYFPSMKKDTTDKASTVSQKHNLKVKSLIAITGCVLGLANIHTWDDILKRFGVRKAES